MSVVNEQIKRQGNEIFKNVILKKNKLNISTYKICVDLELEEPELIKSFDFTANQVYEIPVVGKKHLTN